MRHQSGPIAAVLGLLALVRRIIAGSVSAILVLALVALMGASETIVALIADRSVWSILFLLMLAILLADLIAKFISIVSTTFPDLIPKFDDQQRKRASILRRLRPGQTIALLSGAYLARVVLFLAVFALLGLTYGAVPNTVQQTLFGTLSAGQAIEAFVREGIAGSLGYFLFFLGPNNLAPITGMIAPEPLATSTMDGDLFLVAIRLYGLALVLSALQTLVAPIIYIRARMRARRVDETEAVARGN
ncbi:hypothetical protein [Terricaulis sp.]|uniref:hypothetical protein n=1 Tax=Terricaulis sp. TaxID=2768686 RepID=UPI002AC3DE8D|nr:hypothetical protein [Terricaulis sp.]MDZ4690300.1 hypothetical protein [Terricaulis sp.]